MSNTIEHDDYKGLGRAFTNAFVGHAELHTLFNPIGEERLIDILLHNTTRHCSDGDAEISRFAEIRSNILRDVEKLEELNCLARQLRDATSDGDFRTFDFADTFDSGQIDLLLNRGYVLSYVSEEGNAEDIYTVKPIGVSIRKHVQESVDKWLKDLNEWVYKNKMIQYMNNNTKQNKLFLHSWTASQQSVISSTLGKVATIVANYSCPRSNARQDVRPLFDELLFYLRRKSNGEIASNAIKLKGQYLDMKSLIATEVTSEELLIRIASRSIQSIIHHPPISLWVASGNGLECFQMLRNVALSTRKKKRGLYEMWVSKYGATLMKSCNSGLELVTPEMTFNGLLERLTDEKLKNQRCANLGEIPTPCHVAFSSKYRVRVQDCKFLSEQPLFECLHDTVKLVMELMCYEASELRALQFKKAFIMKIAAELVVDILHARRHVHMLLQTLSVRADIPYRRLKDSFSTQHPHYAPEVYKLCAASSSCSNKFLLQIEYITRNVWENAATCQNICVRIAHSIDATVCDLRRYMLYDPIVLVYNACMLLVPTILQTRVLISAKYNLTNQSAISDLNNGQLCNVLTDNVNRALQWQCFYFLNAYVLKKSIRMGSHSVLSSVQYNTLPRWVRSTLITLSTQHKSMVSFKSNSKRRENALEIKLVVNTESVWHSNLLDSVNTVFTLL